MRPDALGEVVWSPAPETARRSRLFRFMSEHRIGSLEQLQEMSAQDPGWFWSAAVQDLGIRWSRPFETPLDLSRGIEWATWFRGGEMNIVETCLDRHLDEGRAAAPALVWEGESGEVRRVTYGDLAADVSRLASALRRLGVAPGDRVALFLPPIPEAATAALACAKVGAVMVPLSAASAPATLAARINDTQAKVLVCADGFRRMGTVVGMKEIADRALDRCRSVRKVIVHRHIVREIPWRHGRDLVWEQALEDEPATAESLLADPETPLMILHTSGVAGRPKGALHVHGGFPVKAAQDLAHGFDVGPGDTVLWFEDSGSVTGPWLMFGALILGATAVLYEGSPLWPDGGRAWRLVEAHGVTHLGMPPRLAGALMAAGGEGPPAHDLGSLRILGGGGEPWTPDPWLWLFQAVGGGRIPLINHLAGAESSGSLLCGNPLAQLRPCSFAGPPPGVAADVVDESGRSVRGEPGELVVRAPWPGMARGFWQDAERYLATHWSRFPGAWFQDDRAWVDPRDGLWYATGRFQDAVGPATRRVGAPEVEAVLASHPRVAESAVVEVPAAGGGERIACFVVLRPGELGGDALARELAGMAATALGASPPRPAVHFVSDLPRTHGSKVLRRVVRAAYLGSDLGDLSTLENPSALEAVAAARG